jgi:Carboxypeptidase regulatory-like domain
MRLLFTMLIGSCLGTVRPCALAQAKHDSVAARYEITGVVINSVGGDPVPHCHLTPTLTGSGQNGSGQNGSGQNGRGGFGNRQFPALANTFECDAHGRFTVTVPSAGSWRLTASARGFVSQAYDEHQLFSSAIVLTAEAPTKDLEFRLSPEASIAGVVLDEAGEPVRNAQVTLQNVPRLSPGGPQPAGNTRGTARTDDRGMYELPNLSPGEYRLSVRAQPWYAANAQAVRGGNNSDDAALDPSLDFAYPGTWFPGVSDPAMAETIVLHAGDTRQADFHLIPIPSIHMRIVTPPRVNNGPNTPPAPAFPIIQQVNSGGGGANFVQISTRFDQQGQIDVGGLTPGLYQVRLAGPNQDGHVALVEVSANSTRTLDLSAPSRDMARITLHLDGVADSDSNSRTNRNGGVQVTLVDTDTHRGSFSSNGNEGGGATPVRRDQRDPNADRILEVPPGRYEVVLQGRPNIFLTGLSAKGAEVAGRYVTVGAGDSTLTVHVASGRASLSGVATLGVATSQGKPSVGAMVLLVPITIEDPNSITFLRQDQTNTDGSFDLANVIPGQYILVAIDHGWQVNWGDASTLRRYLMQGVPVDLKSSAMVKQNVTAQAP